MKKEDNVDEETLKTKSKQAKESESKKKKKKQERTEKQDKKEKNKKDSHNSNKETIKEETNKTNYAENMKKQETENSAGNDANVSKEQIKFFKKMKYSIAKVSKYDEMADLGFKVSLKYFCGVICIVSVLLPIAVAIGTIVTGEEDWSAGSLLYNMLIYYLGNIIILALVYTFFILIISMCVFLVTKIVKMKEKFSKWLSLTVYASTLSIIIFEIFFTLDMIGLGLPYYDLITLLIIYIYIAIILRKKRGGTKNAFYRRNKKKSKKRNKNNNSA